MTLATHYLMLAVFIAWVLAFVRTLVNLALIPRLATRDPRLANPPFVSLIIPARDEERTIERTVRALLAQTYANYEVIVVNDRSTDRTEAILASIDDARLVVVHGQEPPGGWLGKPWALHEGSRRARGEILLFVDADVIYAPGALAAAVERLETSGAAMLTLLPRIEMKGFWENAAMPMLAMTVFTFLPSWLVNRSRIVWLALGGGTGNLVRRADYDAAGGHEALKDAVVDDIALGRLIRRAGKRTEIARADDLVSIRMYHGGREIVDGFTKNLFVAMGRSYVVAGLLSIGSLVFHILPYLLALTGNAWAIGTVVLISVTRIALFRSLGYSLVNAAFLHPVMVAFWAWVVLRSVWITGVRRKVHWRGRTYDAAGTRFGADR